MRQHMHANKCKKKDQKLSKKNEKKNKTKKNWRRQELNSSRCGRAHGNAIEIERLNHSTIDAIDETSTESTRTHNHRSCPHHVVSLELGLCVQE